ncbi:thioredoxin [Archaeoglobales archaeon]|nr:MAG: thioredoxin [Archaeoglobales archaeon]
MDELERIRQKKMREMMEKMLNENKPKIEYPDHPIILTSSNFEEVLKKYRYVVVDFWAEWCAPCRLIAPIVETLAKEYAGDVVFGKLNTSEEPGIANRFAITAIPSLIFFRNGKPVDKIVGAVPKGDITRWIRKNMV